MSISRRGNLLFFGLFITISLIHNVRPYQNSILNPSCAENGAYCQTHNECCSRKCMTFSYKCAPVIRPEVMHSPPENDYVPASNNVPACAAHGAYCQTHNECCSGKCMTYSYICAPVVRPEIVRSPPKKNNYVPINWWLNYFEKPTFEQIEIATLPDDKSNTGTHAVEKVDSSVTTTNLPQVSPTGNRTCKNVGNECSDNRECCSLRCHSYLHRCVT